MESTQLSQKPERPLRIGIFDSGIGGLTVAKPFLAHSHAVSLFYLGDTARVPYGNKSPESIQRFTAECVSFLVNTVEVDRVILACNTASALALGSVKKIFPRTPIEGVISPAVDAFLEAEARLEGGKNSTVLVLATRATVNSKVYEKTLASRAFSGRVISYAPPLWVSLVEEGWLRGELIEAILLETLRPLFDSLTVCPNVVILGCTHFPLLKDAVGRVFESHYGRTPTMINSGQAIENTWVRQGLIPSGELLPTHPSAHSKSENLRIFVTDDEKRFNTLSELFLGQSPLAIERVTLGASLNHEPTGNA